MKSHETWTFKISFENLNLKIKKMSMIEWTKFWCKGHSGVHSCFAIRTCLIQRKLEHITNHTLKLNSDLVARCHSAIHILSKSFSHFATSMNEGIMSYIFFIIIDITVITLVQILFSNKTHFCFCMKLPFMCVSMN